MRVCFGECLLATDFIILQLPHFIHFVSFQLSDCICIIDDFCFMLHFQSLQLGQFLVPFYKFRLHHLELFVRIDQVSQNSFVFGFKVAVGRVHIVELRLKLKSELNLFFMVFRVLRVVLFQLHPLLLFICAFTLQLFGVLCQSVVRFPKNLFVLSLFCKLLLILTFQLV
jgi:hypothetical protein